MIIHIVTMKIKAICGNVSQSVNGLPDLYE